MLLDIIKQFYWLDILLIIILFRIGYIAFKNGLTMEIFKFFGSIAAIYVPMHYYSVFSDWIIKKIPLIGEKTPLQFLDFISFTCLAIISYVIFILMRIVFNRFIQMKAAQNLNRWGGLILGIARGFLLTGVITFMLAISCVSYLKQSVINSYSAKYLLKIAPATYSWLWNGFFSKIAPSEKFNETILEVQKDINLNQ
jgi:uncharacterized membrane protein required for colicin V production